MWTLGDVEGTLDYASLPLVEMRSVLSLFMRLRGVCEGNWKEVDRRLRLVRKLVSHHRAYMEHDLETVKWEKLASAVGQVADAAEAVGTHNEMK